MSYIDEIKLEGELGEKRFVMPDGKITKTFYNASGFDQETGEFAIYDESSSVVEYMDLMGHFSLDKTELAKQLSDYIQTGQHIPVKRFGFGDLYYCGLVDFPSKFLAEPDVYEFIRNHEKLRYKRLCKGKCFGSLFERIHYKNYITEVWKAKINKLKRINTASEEIDKVAESKELS